MSLIYSQAHAPWLTTKLRRPKTFLTLSIGLKHFSFLLGILETDFLVFWKLFFCVHFFFWVFWKLIFWVFWKLIFQVFQKLIFWVLEASFCVCFFFSQVFWKLIFWIFQKLIFWVLEANFLGIFSEVLGIFFVLIFWATDITRQITTLDLSEFGKFLGFRLLDTMVVGFCS